MGSVFSPYYAWSRKRDPLDHCAVNLALYGKGGRRWTMTERGRAAVERTPTRLVIGSSSAQWQGDRLRISIAEWSSPWPRRIVGEILFEPQIRPRWVMRLDEAGRHLWQPIAPEGRIEVRMTSPARTWTGRAYLDSNWGSEPLESGFETWTWARPHAKDGPIILYDATRRDRSRLSLMLRPGPDAVAVMPLSEPLTRIDRTPWGISREMLAEGGTRPTLRATLEDGPFYARSIIETNWAGERLSAFHESLSLSRLRNPVVKLMLPVRMPRRRL